MWRFALKKKTHKQVLCLMNTRGIIGPSCSFDAMELVTPVNK
jgi:hypothetical protein